MGIEEELREIFFDCWLLQADCRLMDGNPWGVPGEQPLEKPTKRQLEPYQFLTGITEGMEGKKRKLFDLFEKLPAKIIAGTYDMQIEIPPSRKYDPGIAEEKKRKFINEILKAYPDQVLADIYDQSHDTLEGLLTDIRHREEQFGSFDAEPYVMRLNMCGQDRPVEIPAAQKFLVMFDPETVVEIGAVMPYYTETGEKVGIREVKHRVIDPFDPWPGCIREDGEKTDIRGKNVLCISTLEHCGKIEYENTYRDPLKGVRMFDRIVDQAAHYLITFPHGHNEGLDDHIKERGAQGFTYLYARGENDIAAEWKRIPGITCDFPLEGIDAYLFRVFFVTNVEL